MILSVIGLAIVVARTNIPARGLLTSILLWPIFVSPLVIGFGAILTYGPSGYITTLVTRISSWSRGSVISA
jgi:iron(III) transport system permease protein